MGYGRFKYEKFLIPSQVVYRSSEKPLRPIVSGFLSSNRPQGRLARVRRKRCDIDKSLHTLVDSRGGNYDAAPRMAHKNDGAAGAIQGALYRRDIILQRGQRVLNCDDLEPVRLEERDDFAPGRTVGR